MAPQQRLRTALTLLALVSAPRNTVGQRAGACDKAPCLNGGTCHESVPADGGSHRHLQDTCAGASVAARTEEIDAQCCGTDDSGCAEGIPTSCDSGCAAAFPAVLEGEQLLLFSTIAPAFTSAGVRHC